MIETLCNGSRLHVVHQPRYLQCPLQGNVRLLLESYSSYMEGWQYSTYTNCKRKAISGYIVLSGRMPFLYQTYKRYKKNHKHIDGHTSGKVVRRVSDI